MTRFLHTSDWQLGITRHFLSDEAQARYTQARFDVLRRIGALAEEEGCEFVVVAGDVFESNQVDRRTVHRALEALGSIRTPIYLLPGNHDALDAGSVYHSPTFAQRRPEHVCVIESPEPIRIGPRIELIGARWTSRRPLVDLVTAACESLEPTTDKLRVCVAHGAVDVLSPDRDDPSLIRLESAERLLDEGRIHYLALGDRHSLTAVGSSGRIGYSGTPEPTDYTEDAPGHVTVVELGPDSVRVTPHAVGTWRFLRRRFELERDEDLAELADWLENLDDKERTIIKLELVGTLSLCQATRLEALLEQAADLVAALETPARHRHLVVTPEDDDFAELELSGFAARALEALRGRLADGGEEAEVARDALALLVRLAEPRS